MDAPPTAFETSSPSLRSVSHQSAHIDQQGQQDNNEACLCSLGYKTANLQSLTHSTKITPVHHDACEVLTLQEPQHKGATAVLYMRGWLCQIPSARSLQP